MSVKNEFWIKKGDTLPSIAAVLEDSNGNARDLTGATVKFYMSIHPSHKTTKIDGNSAVIVDAANGEVRYDWQIQDTDEYGTYDAEWEVTYLGGGIETFPSKGYNTIYIVKDL